MLGREAEDMLEERGVAQGAGLGVVELVKRGKRQGLLGPFTVPQKVIRCARNVALEGKCTASCTLLVSSNRLFLPETSISVLRAVR
jgi:hypothetical protein